MLPMPRIWCCRFLKHNSHVEHTTSNNSSVKMEDRACSVEGIKLMHPPAPRVAVHHPSSEKTPEDDQRGFVVTPQDVLAIQRSRGRVRLAPGHSPMDWGRHLSQRNDKEQLMQDVSPRELMLHASFEDAWMGLDGHVYNVGKYAKYHPGGQSILLRGAGMDASAMFQSYHGWVNAISLLRTYGVGPLKQDGTSKRFPKGRSVCPASIPVDAQRLRVVAIRDVLPGVKSFLFECQRPLHYLPGQFGVFLFQGEENGGRALRYYTIFSLPNPQQQLEIVVWKRNGVSAWMHDAVQEGDHVALMRVDGSFSCFSSFPSLPKRSLLLVAGGAGITPILCMLRGLDQLAEQGTGDVVLVYCCQRKSSIVLDKEMAQLFDRRGWRAFVFLSREKEDPPSVVSPTLWRKGCGFPGRLNTPRLRGVVKDMMDRSCFVCGPPEFVAGVNRAVISSGGRPIAETFVV